MRYYTHGVYPCYHVVLLSETVSAEDSASVWTHSPGPLIHAVTRYVVSMCPYFSI